MKRRTPTTAWPSPWGRWRYWREARISHLCLPQPTVDQAAGTTIKPSCVWRFSFFAHPALTVENTWLDEAQLKHVFYESPGTSHEWQTWRRDLKEFCPKLFQ